MGGNFEDIKKILDLQIQLGLTIPPRSVVIVMITSHLLKVGHEKFWQESSAFAAWAEKSNLTAIPCLQPYPEMSAANLNTIRQYYCRLQLSHHGDVTKSKNLKFCMWEPLATTATILSKNESANIFITPTPMSVFHLKDVSLNINTPVSASGDFCSGFGKVWKDGMPTEVEKIFLDCVFSTLRKIVASPDIAAANVRIPADQAIEEGLYRAPDTNFLHLVGKKIFCMGSSIVDMARKDLLKQAKLYKVDVIPLCKAGKYLKFVLKQDFDSYLAPLKKSTTNDVLYLGFLGNEILTKTGHEKDKITNTFHIKDPALLTGEEFNILVADTMHVVNAVKKRFNGSICLLGPIPRHLTTCCSDPTHKIRDHIGIEVDMLKYVNAFSDQLKRSLTLPSDTYYIDYRQIFGDTFSALLPCEIITPDVKAGGLAEEELNYDELDYEG